jgi:GH43 family beta-xylosidase
MRRARVARKARTLGIEVLEPRLVLSGTGLTAQYFHNDDFTGLAETRTEAIAFRWGTGSPAPGVDPDTFSVRWTGQIEPEFSESYRFRIGSDWAARVWIDGQLVIDGFIRPVATIQSVPIALVAGQRYDIRVDYFEDVGNAYAELSWSSASQPLELIPADRLYESPAGILGTYADSSGGGVTRVDPNVDYFFGPSGPVGLNADQFSVNWTGQIRADFSELYTFSTISDERVRLWIGNELVIDNWSDHTSTEDIGTKWLEAGKWYEVRLEYYDVQGDSEIRWRWASSQQTNGAFETVPTENLRAIKPGLQTFQNPLGRGADPFVLRHDGYYYLTMTSGSSVSIHRARSLEDIHPDNLASDTVLAWDPPDGTGYSHDVWAPELHRLNGKWYIYVAASDGVDANHRMHVLERDAADPFGPFVYKAEIEVPTDRWAIDGTVLEWQGKTYFIWSGWPNTTGGQQNLYIAEMSNPWTLAGDRVLLSTPTFSWERHGLPINEGPQVLIHDGKLHIIYSGSGFWTHDYALGRLTYNGAGSLLDRNSWSKFISPVFQKTAEVVGTGHASFTISPGGDEYWIVYHAHGSPTNAARDVRIQRFHFNADGTPNFDAPISPTQTLVVPSNGPDPERPMVIGDYNANGDVDSADRNTWSATYGTAVFAGTGADGNGDGVVDAADAVMFRKFRGMQTALRLQVKSDDSLFSMVAPPSDSAAVKTLRVPDHEVTDLLLSFLSPNKRAAQKRPSPETPQFFSSGKSAAALLHAIFSQWPQKALVLTAREELRLECDDLTTISHELSFGDVGGTPALNPVADSR